MNKSTDQDKKDHRTIKHRCIHKDAVVEVFLKETIRGEKFRLLDHIFSCPGCLAEFQVLKEVWKRDSSLMDSELEKTLEAAKAAQIKSISALEIKSMKQERKSRKRLRFSPKTIAAAAALFVAAVLIIYIATQNRPEHIPLEREVGSEIFRTIEPESAISQMPILFRWSPVHGAKEYTIVVLNKGLEVIYKKEGIHVASFGLPDKIYSQLQVSKTYFWKVIATLDAEKNIESEFGKFTLTER